MRIDQTNVNFEVYEDSINFCGIAKLTLPNLQQIAENFSGAGIAGNVEAVVRAHFDAMTLGIDFRTTTEEAIRLMKPERHTLDIRAARQDEDTEAGQIVIAPVKYIAVVMPKSLNLGSLAPHSRQDASGDYAIRYWATYIEGKLVTELDQLNYKGLIDGKDYLAPVRAALGK